MGDEPRSDEGRWQERVGPGLVGERLDRVVAMLIDVTRARARALVEGGAVTVEGTECRVPARRLVLDEVVRIEATPIPDPPEIVAQPEVEFTVVFEDRHLIVVDKPAGLVVHPGAGHPDGTLVNGLVARYPEISGVGEFQRPGIVHRLDRDTSGLMVVARTEPARVALVEALAERRVGRWYRTLVWGVPDSAEGRIEAPIGRAPSDPTRMAVVASGRPGTTSYRTIASRRAPDLALVECRLHTGRTHQIRVHLSAIGHPVVGDRRYGGVRPAFDASRVFLHAARLELVHPIDERPLAFDSPDPADLAAALTDLDLQ